MGTDIHLAAEKLNDQGVWENIPGPIKICYSCGGTGLAHKWVDHVRVATDEPCLTCTDDGSSWEDEGDISYYASRYVGAGRQRESWYDDRNYYVFACLAGVRNGSGFAGVRTHAAVAPIAEGRGLPSNISRESEALLSGEHSPTWALLSEVLESPLFKGDIIQNGVVTIDQYRALLVNGERPDGWSGSISGGSVITVSELDPDLQRWIADQSPNPKQPKATHVQATWVRPASEPSAAFLQGMRDLHLAAGRQVDPGSIRLVMDFDS